MSSFIPKNFLQNLKNSLVAKRTIDGGTLGRPVDSWVAYGDRATIFQQHCSGINASFFFSVHDFLSVPLLFAASSQCPILCSGCQGEWFGSRERCDCCQGSGGSLHCGERDVEGQSLTPLTHPQWPPNSQTIFSNVILWIKKIKISLKFVPKGPLDNNPALVHVMAWQRIGDKPLSEPMLTPFTEAYTWH